MPSDPPSTEPVPPPAEDSPPRSSGRDPYGPQMGCMISLGVLVLLAPAMLYVNAPVFMVAAITGVLAWFLHLATPAAWKAKIGPVRMFVIYWIVFTLVAAAVIVYLKYAADAGAGDIIRRM